MDYGDCLGKGEFFNPVLAMGTQVSCLLVISHFFQILLKPLGQPAPLAQILSGFVLGPSCLSHINSVKTFFFYNSTEYYETMVLYARMIIMFLIGLEADIAYVRRNFYATGVISGASCLVCTVFALAATTFIYEDIGAHGSPFMMALTLAIILSNTAGPFVVRLAHDLKFASTDLGRLAISCSMVCDGYAAVLLIVMSRNKRGDAFSTWFFLAILYFAIIFAVVLVNRYVANWLNRRNRNHKYLKNTELFVLLAIFFVAAMSLETMGFSSIIACFLIGAMFPRGGKTGRTLLTKLTYTVHNFVLPVYFGCSGFKADVTYMGNLRGFGIVAILILLSIGGKVTGILAACFHLKIPPNEGVHLAFLMNLKGHVDLLALTIVLEDKVVSSQLFYNLMVAAVVVNSLIWGPIIASVVKNESNILGYTHVAFECQSPESELKLLACVHNPRPLTTMIGLVATFTSESIAITPYLMHLIELPEKTKTHLLYHQKEEDELSDDDDDDDYGGNDEVEINEVVDIFAFETGVNIRQSKVVAPYARMYSEICEFAEDSRTSFIILPFHKHQRIDGKLESGKEGIRTTNQKVLRFAKCSVAILVDRGLTAGASLEHVAVLFFGGPDDREALGLSKRLGMHHHVSLTVIRFLHASQKLGSNDIEVAYQDRDVLLEISSRLPENDMDNKAMSDFFNRYVTSGQVGYVEKHVENGEETAAALRDMADMYSMFIVGKGAGCNSLTIGLSDWEECPELGKVGDYLASSDFDLGGSVLVIQQHRSSRNGDGD